MAKKAPAKASGSAAGRSFKVKPLEDRVLIEQVEAEETTSGGIVLPDTAKEKPQRGTVVAVGPGKLNDKGERVAPGVAVGDTVVYGRYSGTEIKLDNQRFIICRASDLLGVLED